MIFLYNSFILNLNISVIVKNMFLFNIKNMRNFYCDSKDPYWNLFLYFSLSCTSKKLFHLNFNLQEQNSSIEITETVFFSFIGQGVPINPNGLTGRVLLFSVSITGAIIFWSYSAGLVSFITFDKIDFIINTYSVR